MIYIACYCSCLIKVIKAITYCYVLFSDYSGSLERKVPLRRYKIPTNLRQRVNQGLSADSVEMQVALIFNENIYGCCM